MFETIRSKIDAGERLSAAEGEYLFREDVDLHAVGQLADLVRRRKHGNAVYYNINAHLNPTNVCVYRCPLCAYSRDAGDGQAYVMSRDEILGAVPRRWSVGRPSCTLSADCIPRSLMRGTAT